MINIAEWPNSVKEAEDYLKTSEIYVKLAKEYLKRHYKRKNK